MTILLYMIVLGFLATAAIGIVASGIDRKVTARVQYRVGPPLLQPFTDLVKLLGKENMVPSGASRIVFFGSPLIGFASVVLVSTILWINFINPSRTFGGDLIVAVYLLAIPSLSLMMGGFSSGNPLASIGSSREMKLILGYELPFILAIAVPIIKTGGLIRLGDILNYQTEHGLVAGSISGTLALIAALLCVQAKLGLVPFDIAEAESEIVGGPLIEYSGTGLALFKLMKNMLLFVLPFFLMILYLGNAKGGALPITLNVLKYVAILVAIVLIRNTNPRVRIDQAVKFFWVHLTGIAVIAVVLALLGF